MPSPKNLIVFIIALIVIGVGALIWYSVQDEYGGDKCCWNNPLEACTSDADCDIGGQGCMRDGSLNVNAGIIDCQTCKARGLPYNAVTRSCGSTGKCCTEWNNESCNTDRDCDIGGCNICPATVYV